MSQQFWTVLEIQEIDPDTRASSSAIYTDHDAALAAFFTVCAAAARSGLPYHAAVIIPSVQPLGRHEVGEWQVFDRRESNG